MNGVKIFGVGLQRTGTSTLKLALRRLGCRHCAYSGRLVRAWHRGRHAPLRDAVAAHDSFDDWPWPLVWREMEALCAGQGRFILTRRRDSRAWLDSVTAHARRARAAGHVRRWIYGAASPEEDPDAYLRFYDRHLDALRAHFETPERQGQFLELCWEEGDGWEELCKFLDVPRRNAIFPHANARKMCR